MQHVLFVPLVFLALVLPSATGSSSHEIPSWAFPKNGMFVPLSVLRNEADMSEYVSKKLGLLMEDDDVSKRGTVPQGEKFYDLELNVDKTNIVASKHDEDIDSF